VKSAIVSRETKQKPTRPSRTVAIANQKGGVGKTTTTVNLTASLAHLGYRVLVVDSDPQGNTTSGFGIEKAALRGSLYHALVDGEDLDALVVRTMIAGLDLVPSTIQLAGAELEIAGVDEREFRLRKILESVKPWYDYIVIDTPPSLSLLTINALTAASDIVIPVQAEFYALEGLSQLNSIIERVRESLNPDLQMAGAVLTMFDSRIRLALDVAKELEALFPAHLFATKVPRNVRLSEAPSFGKPVLLFDPKSRGALAYLELANEFLLRVPLAAERKNR
jgi:chromosome partitioning protein